MDYSPGHFAPIDSPPESLRLNAKRGIVSRLDAAGSVAQLKDYPYKSWS
jgi:hypothetical protein